MRRLMRALMNFVFAGLCCAGHGALAGAAPDPAAGYPSKPIRWIIDFSAGGLSDILARTVGQKLTEAWGQPVVNDVRPGANGTIAYGLGAKATADGYTLTFVSTPFSLNVTIYDKLSYDAQADFAPISSIALYPNLLVANLKVPAKTVAELIAHARSRSEGLTYASVGSASSSFLATELLKKQQSFSAVHVPYNGSGPALTDLIGGRVEFMFVNMPGAMAHIRGNRVRVIAIAALARSPILPDVPTFTESGVPGFQSVGYTGAVVPVRTPPAIVAKLNREIVRALKLADVRERIEGLGGEARGSTPAEFRQFLNEEIARWAPVIRETGARIER